MGARVRERLPCARELSAPGGTLLLMLPGPPCCAEPGRALESAAAVAFTGPPADIIIPGVVIVRLLPPLTPPVRAMELARAAPLLLLPPYPEGYPGFSAATWEASGWGGIWACTAMGRLAGREDENKKPPDVAVAVELRIPTPPSPGPEVPTRERGMEVPAWGAIEPFPNPVLPPKPNPSLSWEA